MHQLDEYHTEQNQNVNRLAYFDPATPQEVKRIIQNSPNKSCELDPIPTWLLKLQARIKPPIYI